MDLDEESDYAEAEETVAEDDGAAHSPLQAVGVEPVSSHISATTVDARQSTL